jgi:cholest-4-en-3-one 26-monooxygenase
VAGGPDGWLGPAYRRDVDGTPVISPTMDLGDIDLNDPDQFVPGVPHEVFAELRHNPPYWQDEPGGPGYWNFTRHADVVLVNKDNATFSSNRGTALITEMPQEDLERQRMMMLNMDPPMHTRYRLLVNKGFTPRMVGALEENARRMTSAILDRAIEARQFDFVTDVAAELPLQVIADLMGVPQADRHLVFDWSNRMIGSNDPEYMADPGEAEKASMELFAYCHQLTEDKKASPDEDLMSILTRVEVDGEKLNELEIDLFFMLLAVAGNETTRNLMAHGMLALLEHPEQFKEVVADPSLVPGAIEEMLRWGSPVMHFRRTTTRPTEVNGFELPEGAKVVIWYIAANRDETVFEDPYRFDIHRDPNPHVAFGGGGPHFCLGANLARLEIRVMFDEIVRRLPDLQQTGPAERLRSNFINGIKHLPVTV